MKVEFMDTDNGAYLFIAESEFIKAKEKEHEFTSLMMAIDGFSNICCGGYGYKISQEEYDAVLDRLEKGGTVTVGFCGRRRQEKIEICVRNGNHSEVIVYSDQDGYHIRHYAKVSKKSLESAKRRIEAKRKDS